MKNSMSLSKLMELKEKGQNEVIKYVVIITIFCLCFITLSLFIMYFSFERYDIQYFQSQEIRKTSLCPNGCLCIHTYRLLGNPPHLSERYRQINNTYYFAEEKSLLYDNTLEEGDRIKIKWVYIKEINASRIRGVYR